MLLFVKRHPLRTLHLALGILGLVVFILTGQYMDRVHDHLRGMPEGPRLFMRSAHLYIMWSSLPNLLLGCHLTWPSQWPARVLQLLSSLPVLASPVLLGLSFFVEPHGPSLMRPMAAWSMILAMVGVLGHVLSVVLSHRASGTHPPEGRALDTLKNRV